MKVHCDNKADGCEWTGELRSLEEHLTGCDFSFVPCPNECKDDSGEIVKLQCKDLRKHKRTTTHLEKCPNIRVACPNSDCREKVPRYNLAIHRRDCPFEEVPCKFARIGCNSRFPRREKEDHESDAEQHLQMAIDTVSELKSKLVEQQTSVFMLRNFEYLKTGNRSVYSTPFYTSSGGYKMTLGVHANGDGDEVNHNISVYAFVIRGVNDNHLSWPFTGRVTVELLNQLEDANHYVRCIYFPKEARSSNRVIDGTVGSGYGFRGYIPHSSLGYDAARNCQYLKDDCLCFRVRAEAPSPKPWLNTTGDFLNN